jgi:hypothetical protein
MSQENALAIYNQFDQLQRAATALHASGYFSDSKNQAQAIVKVMAGAELGLPPFAAMTGIHIIQGKPTLGANVIATLIKNDPRYDYRVVEHSDKVCRIKFFENGQECGVSEFTADDARRAGTKNMDKYPKNMLFSRAISNGAKWYTPGIFGGAPVYTPDELGMEVDEDGVIIEGEYSQPAPVQVVTPQAEPTPPAPKQPSAAMIKRFHALGVEKFGDDWDNARAALVSSATDGRTTSSKELTYDEMVALAEELKQG